MAWIQGEHNGVALDVLEQLVNFLTTNETLITDGDVWTVIGQTTDNITHPTAENFIVDKGYYLRGNGITTAPILFIYSAHSSASIAQGLAFTSLYAYDDSLADMWWLQPGASYDYAPVAVTQRGGTFEWMANGRRIYGYFKNDTESYFPFYAGWFIPYTDTQHQNYTQPVACLGSDRYLQYCTGALGYDVVSYSIGMCNVYYGGNASLGNDSSNKGQFVCLPSGTKSALRADSQSGVVSALSSQLIEAGGDKAYSIKQRGRLSVNATSRLYPEILRYYDQVLGELDGVVSIGTVGAVAGALINDDSCDWVVIFQRNVPKYGIDGYAMRRC